MRTNLRIIGVLGPGGLGSKISMEFAERIPDHVVEAVQTPSPFDPEPMMITDPYKDLPNLVQPYVVPTHNSRNKKKDRTPPSNVFGLGEVGELEAQMFNKPLMLIEVQMFNLALLPPFCQTPVICCAFFNDYFHFGNGHKTN